MNSLHVSTPNTDIVLSLRIPRDEVTTLFELIKRSGKPLNFGRSDRPSDRPICHKLALKIEAKLRIDPMGSYRRGEETSGDCK